MNEEQLARAHAIGRCRQSYALNEIPWDGSIASKVQRMTTEKIHALANYWETRATVGPTEKWPGDAGAEDAPPTDALTIRECKRVLDKATGNSALNRPPRAGQRAFIASQIAYNGRGGSVRD